MRRGELLLLPARRHHAPVRSVERHEKRRVHDAQAQDLFAVDRKFRVEAHVAAARAVEELAIEQHARLREDVLEEQRLAPADVREDHVGVEALAPELDRAGGDALAAMDRPQDRHVEGVRRFELGQVVTEKRYPRQTRLAQQVGLFPNPDYSKTRFPRVMGRQVAVLAREILVNKQQAHQTGSLIARLK